MPEEIRASKTRVPWLEMMRYRPFARLLRTVVGWSITYGGTGSAVRAVNIAN